MICYDDFAKLEITIGEIQTVEVVEGADKLLKLTVDLGAEAGTRSGRLTSMSPSCSMTMSVRSSVASTPQYRKNTPTKTPSG